jgi:hypothetical protein
LGISSNGEALEGFAHYLDSIDRLAQPYIVRNEGIHVCIDHEFNFLESIRRAPKKHNCVLIRLEPAVVLPANYNSKILRQYDGVISVGGNESTSKLFVNWPQIWPKHPVWTTGSEHQEIQQLNLFCRECQGT